MVDPTPEEPNATFLSRLEDELRSLREASVHTASDRKPVELDQQSVGRLSRMDAMRRQAMAAAQETRRHGRIRAIKAAILRIEAGEFGFCNDCGDFIGLRRLELHPIIRRCRDCAS